jgi:hypothetical protein
VGEQGRVPNRFSSSPDNLTQLETRWSTRAGFSHLHSFIFVAGNPAPNLPDFTRADLRISPGSGTPAELIFPAGEASLIEGFERSPRSAYLRSGCRLGRGSRKIVGARPMLASSVEFAVLSSACFSLLLSSSGNGSVQLQAVSRSFACLQSGRWYSFVIVIRLGTPSATQPTH